MTLKLIVFDFDGTLVNTMDSIWLEYQRVMSSMGLKRISRRDFSLNMGRPWNDVIKSFWPDIRPEEFTMHYRQKSEKAGTIPGVKEALSLLSGDYMLSIMSSRGRKSLDEHMKSSEMDFGVFEKIYSKDDLSHFKPDPRALSKVIGDFKLKPGQCMYVGDSVIDALCARDARARFTGVLSGGGYIKDFEDLGFDVVLDSVASLPKALDEKRL